MSLASQRYIESTCTLIRYLFKNRPLTEYFSSHRESEGKILLFDHRSPVKVLIFCTSTVSGSRTKPPDTYFSICLATNGALGARTLRPNRVEELALSEKHQCTVSWKKQNWQLIVTCLWINARKYLFIGENSNEKITKLSPTIMYRHQY